jgi:hypothetical protein
MILAIAVGFCFLALSIPVGSSCSLLGLGRSILQLLPAGPRHGNRGDSGGGARRTEVAENIVAVATLACDQPTWQPTHPTVQRA